MPAPKIPTAVVSSDSLAFAMAPVPAAKPKAKVKAPAGYEYVKDPARPGKWKLVKIKTTARPRTTRPAATPGAPAAGAAKPSGGFVADEIARQIAQDMALTNWMDQEQAGISGALSSQANEAARIAGQYQPVTTFDNPTLDAAARERVNTDVGLTNQVNQDQSGALAAMIAQNGGAGAALFANMRAAGTTQHRDYSRRLEGLRPELQRQYDMEQLAIKQQAAEEKRAQQQHALALKTQALQNQLAVKEFGLAAQGQDFAQSQASAAAGAASAAEAGKPVDKGRYGFGAQYDEPLTAVVAEWQEGTKPSVDKEGNVIPAKYKQPWRDLFDRIRGVVGLNADQAALFATRTAPDSIRNAQKGAYGVKRMLDARGVSKKVQAFIIRKHFDDKIWQQLAMGPQIPANMNPQPSKPKPKPNASKPKPKPNTNIITPVGGGLLPGSR